jgi:hypothetical protein
VFVLYSNTNSARVSLDELSAVALADPEPGAVWSFSEWETENKLAYHQATDKLDLRFHV